MGRPDPATPPQSGKARPHPGGSGPRPAVLHTLIAFSVLREWPIVLGRATTFVPARRHLDGPHCMFFASVRRLASFAPSAPDPGSAYYDAGRLRTVMASWFGWAFCLSVVIFASPIQPTMPGARDACFFNSTAGTQFLTQPESHSIEGWGYN